MSLIAAPLWRSILTPKTIVNGTMPSIARAAPARPKLACRSMTENDIDAAAGLLTAGFPQRSADYWRCGLRRLRDRSVPDGCPRFGYVMTDHGRLVGILLLIVSEDADGRKANVSSWYVEPDYRGLSHLLLAAPLKMKDIRLVNISPAPGTIETIRAQGFAAYVAGTFEVLAALAPARSGASVRQVAAGDRDVPQLLSDHAEWGCLCLIVSHGGATYPFVFTRSRFVRGALPCAQLVYCHDVDDFVRFAGTIGRHLLRLGLFAVLVDANGPVAGLPGVYRAGRGKRFARGANHPRIGDLSYTELAIFGP